MASRIQSETDSPAASSLFLPLSRKRRGSGGSVISQIDKETLSNALDTIHSAASTSEALTVFNEYTSPPPSSAADNKRITGDFQGSLSGLYSRLRGANISQKNGAPATLDNDGEVASPRSISLPSPILAAAPDVKSPSNPPLSSETNVAASVDRKDDLDSPSADRNVREATSTLGKAIATPHNDSGGLYPDDAIGTSTLKRPSVAPSKSSLTLTSKSSTSVASPAVAQVNVNATRSSTSVASVSKVTSPGVKSPSIDALAASTPVGATEKLKASSDRSSSTGAILSAIHPSQQERHEVTNSRTDSIDSRSSHEPKSSSPELQASTAVVDAATLRHQEPGLHQRQRQKPEPVLTGGSLASLRLARGLSDVSATSTPLSIPSVSVDNVDTEDDDQPVGRIVTRPMPSMTRDAAPRGMSVVLSQIKKRVLSKEYWMRDENAKDCFYCGDSFSTFRRKHHCRTCGQIFDAKCTSLVSGVPFGQSGTIRVCKPCEGIINGYDDSSEASEEDSTVGIPISRPRHGSSGHPELSPTRSIASAQAGSDLKDDSLLTMAIPATRRLKDESKRRSAILEIDAEPRIPRPGSSRSLKSSSGLRSHQSIHKRHHSRSMLQRSMKSVEDAAPFLRPSSDDVHGGKKLPAFHSDSVIDPDLAAYLSDEHSSGDEQGSIMSALNGDGHKTADSDRSMLSGIFSSSRRTMSRLGGKSFSGLSTDRDTDTMSISSAKWSNPRSARRRNMSTSSNMVLHGSPRPQRWSSPYTGALSSTLHESMNQSAIEDDPANVSPRRSSTMKGQDAPTVELNKASTQHVHKLLLQLLQDAKVPNTAGWEKALMPILLQAVDDVTPDVQNGDDMDIRHYVKFKKVEGKRPGDTAYVSGLVFTKNLALKSMPRNISYPNILILTFPIEYSRHKQHFMSLDLLIRQEREYLQNLVHRIAALRPHILFCQKNIAGLALEFLSQVNIAVVSNVKPSVLEAISRCSQTRIITSIDKLAVKPAQAGRCASVYVRTHVHAGRRKTLMYLSGCPKELGCTIVLRGADPEVLRAIKRIGEFMIFVVYNLKLETYFLRDEFALIPAYAGNGTIEKSQKSSSSQPPKEKRSMIVRSRDANREQQSVVLGHDGNENELDTHRDGVSLHPTLHPSDTGTPDERALPEHAPLPTFWSEDIERYKNKILSSSPCVQYMQPYLLMRAREQEVRLKFLMGLLENSNYDDANGDDSKPRKFQLITEEMIHENFTGTSQKVHEVLRAVQEAEYDKAVHNYQTQKKQWESYIGANSKLFDPFTHQNIAVLYSVVCTATSIPCSGPDTLALGFYSEHEISPDFEADCTLGQYVEDLCLGAGAVCDVNGCERKMFEHHRQYVHGSAQLSVTVEAFPCKLPGFEDIILMWSICRICGAETQVLPMSDNTWKYSFGKYLELSFWGHDLHPRTAICGHDLHKNFRRLFGFKNIAVRIQYDHITLLEIIVPRTRITWKVTNDLQFKNEVYRKAEDRINRFMKSVKARLSGIRIDSVLPDKLEAGREEVDRLTKKAEEEHRALIAKIQEKYMGSKYFEVIPLNRAIRATQEKVAEWDLAFSQFEKNYFPSEKDITRLATLQLRRIIFDRDDSVTSLTSTDETSSTVSEIEFSEKTTPDGASVLTSSAQDLSLEKTENMLAAVIEDQVVSNEERKNNETPRPVLQSPFAPPPADSTRKAADDEVKHLDLAITKDAEAQETEIATQQSSPSISRQNTANIILPARGATPEMERKKASVSQIPRRSVVPSTSNNRTQSQPAKPRRSNTSSISSLEGSQAANTTNPDTLEAKDQASTVSGKGDKKLSDRLGLTALKTSVQSHSMIPRSVATRKKDTKVSSLAKHFEQLSREFERERLRDRRQRASRNRQSRAYPTAASKPIVEIYRNVHEAVAERGPSDEDVTGTANSTEARSSVDIAGETIGDDVATGNTQHDEPLADGTASVTDNEDYPAADKEAEIDADADVDNDAGVTKTEEDQLINLPNFSEGQGILSPSEAQLDLKLEIPRHEKNSLMNILTNFWAERSASGWQALDYPLRSLDHIFADSDIIIREDEPSSLIAFALESDDYKAKLQSIHDKSARTDELLDKPYVDDLFLTTEEQMRIERSLLQSTGTHLKYQFQEGSAKMLCKIFYAEQFDAVRRKCGVADRIVESLSRCAKWDSKGGKTKSDFLKTLDDRLVLKSLSQIETQAFLRFAPAYFQLMGEALFHELPSVIAKMLGFYQIIIKNPATGVEFNWFLLVMENLFYDRSPNRIFDLKGSMRNRRIQSTGKQNEVLLDENMVDFIYESPLFAREHSKKLLRASVWNDTLFLSRQNVMDYSLMVAIDEKRKELVVGIIDCIRTYTWDKKLESWIKDRGKNRPTVTSPREYKNRFREAMGRYVLQAPTCWHQFHNPQPHFRITYHDTNVAHSRVEEQQGREVDRPPAQEQA